MRNRMLLLAVVMLAMFSIANSQTMMDYVKAVRGDTLVIKDFTDMSQQQNSLYNVLNADTLNVPVGRVYMLKKNGYYPLVNSPNTSRATVIVGEDPTILVQNTNALSAPPVICGAAWDGGSNTGGINYSYDLTVKNCSIVPADAKADLGWNFFWSNGSAGTHFTLDNCMLERTRWVFFATGNPGQTYNVRNCYFVNMNGQPCRRNGGVVDVFNFQDTMWVENSTFIMAQGSMFKFRGYPYKRAVFNHNTFINCSGYMFLDWGLQTKMSTTNNIFVNCNVQPYPGISSIDVGEQDLDMQPMGLVNVHDFPADTSYNSYRSLPRKYLFEGNVVYWDPKLGSLVSTLNTGKVNGVSAWQDQMIIMNARTTSMFNNKSTYPYLKLGTNYTTVPTFTQPKDLLTTQVDALKAFTLSTADTNSTAILPDWRLVSTGSTNYIYSDWPIQVNLAYNNAALLTGATNGFPVGDLNWFASQKTAWLAQRTAEYTKIENAVNTGTSTLTAVEDHATVPTVFELQQNYPNPFNPSTSITFALPHAANITLKVFDVLGREVATLVNRYMTAGAHEVRFDASHLSSGVYLYILTSGDFTQTKKMSLVK